MADCKVILIVGESASHCSKDTILRCFRDGLLTTPNFDTLNFNALLKNVDDLTVVPEQESLKLNASSPDFDISVLYRPSVPFILDCFEENFASLPRQIYIIYAGLICQSTGHWVLPNGVFKPSLLADRINLVASKIPETLAIEGKPTTPIDLHIGCTSLASGGDWRHLSGLLLPIAGRSVTVTVNRHHGGSHSTSAPKAGAATKTGATPELAPIPTDVSGVESFCQHLATKLPEASVTPGCSAPKKDLKSPICISRPCLYVFPESSGQSSIFALPGFSLMVNTGCSRDSKAWKMAQHFENIDAIMQTHWGVDNLFGLTSILPALMPTVSAAGEEVPKVTCLLTAPPGGPQLFTSPATSATTDPFSVNIVNEVGTLWGNINKSRLVPIELTRGTKLASTPKPLPLYYKTGYGSLDLYPLTPSEEDQVEVKKLAELWNKAAPGLAAALSGAGSTAAAKTATASKMAVTLVSKLSVSALLVWRPTTGCKKTDEAGFLRILFVAPNAHQGRVLSALEALHMSLPYIKQFIAFPDVSTTASVAKKPGVAGAAHRPTTARKPANGAPTQRPAMGTVAPASRSTGKPATASASKPTSSRAPVAASQLKRPGALPAKSAKPTSAASKQPAKPHTNAAQSEDSVAHPPTEVGDVAEHMAETNGKSEDTVNIDSKSPSQEVNVAAFAELVNEENNNHHHHDEEDESNSVTAKSPTNGEHAAFPADPIVDWSAPQALPPPEHPAAGRKPTAATAVAAKQLPEGYFEASHITGGPGKAPYDKLKPTYVDVAFLPGGGDVRFVDAEWFKFVRARFYVGTTVAPTADLLKALVVGKEAWAAIPSRLVQSTFKKGEDSSIPVSLILAHDTRDLLMWAAVNEVRMLAAKIDLLTVADRSTIQLVQSDAATVSEDVIFPGFRLDL